MAGNIFFEEIYDGDLCKAAESFEDKINITNKEEEAETVEKWRFVELSKDDKIYIIKQINKPRPCITYILLTKREGRTGRISARGLDSTDRAQRGPYKKDRGPIFSQYRPEQAWLIRDLLYD